MGLYCSDGGDVQKNWSEFYVDEPKPDSSSLEANILKNDGEKSMEFLP